jgi:hypothetical protein
MSKIIIQIQGGLVQEVFIQGKGIPSKAVVVDEDVEGSDDLDITVVELPEGLYEACVHTEGIAKLRKGCDVDRMVKKYLARKVESDETKA